MRIGERPLQRMIRDAQGRRERVARHLQRLDSARVERIQTTLAFDHVQRRAPRGSRLGQRQRSAIELENREQVSAAWLYSASFPMQPASDFQMEYQPETTVEPDRDLFAEPPHFGDGPILSGR